MRILELKKERRFTELRIQINKYPVSDNSGLIVKSISYDFDYLNLINDLILKELLKS